MCVCIYTLVVNVSAPHAVAQGFISQPDHTKDHYKNGTDDRLPPCLAHRL